MFHQNYIEKNDINNYITEVNKTNNEFQLEANTAYYLTKPVELNDSVYISGAQGKYYLVATQNVFYNPIAGKLSNYTLTNGKVYKISNLLTDKKTVSKIQIEFSEKNTKSLSNNAIFINADMIKGYKQTNNEDKKDENENIIEYATNIYSFETIDDVSTKIRYLGIIPSSLLENEFIILNYYTED